MVLPFLLSIQSQLVVIVALWFRSRFMVIMNTFLFAGLLITYLISAESLDIVNFSFSIVAPVAAISLAISIFYSRRLKSKEQDSE